MTNIKKYTGKKLCNICKKFYHPDNFEMCWDCYSTQPTRITDYKGNEEGYASQKDYEESTQ